MLQGPRLGSSTENFCHLIQRVTADNRGDLFAFCDQDDVWLDDKLERAVRWHLLECGEPVRLYCSRTQFVNEYLKPIKLSPGIKHPPSFGNALVQNIASGNTMVMSHALIVAQKKIKPKYSIWHDWTTYLVATALGGRVRFDEIPTLLYRQHAYNVVGSNDGLLAGIKLVGPLGKGRFRKWTDANVGAVHSLRDEVCDYAWQICDAYEQLRTESCALRRLRLFLELPVRRQSKISNAALAFALTLNIA